MRLKPPAKPGFVRTLSPVRAWMGAKRLLLRHILPLVPPCETYVEPFAGAAWLAFNFPMEKFLGEPRIVVNDINPGLIDFYKAVASDALALCRLLYYAPHSRAMFESRLNERRGDPLRRALRFAYLNFCCFGARMNRPTYGYFNNTKKGNAYQNRRLCPIILASAEAARGMEFLCRDWRKVLDEHDAPGAFFYIDPPYLGCEKYYGAGIYERDDLWELAERLKAARCKWLLSGPDCPEIRGLFPGRFMKGVGAIYRPNKGSVARARELLIANYEPPASPEP